MKKTYLLAGLVIGILAVSAVSAAYAANNNYGAWRNMVGDGRAANTVTEQNFDQFTKMHQLMGEGKYEEAQAIRTELGLGQGRGGNCGFRSGTGGNNAGCQGRNGGAGKGANFIDANNNGICDHAEAEAE